MIYKESQFVKGKRRKFTLRRARNNIRAHRRKRRTRNCKDTIKKILILLITIEPNGCEPALTAHNKLLSLNYYQVTIPLLVSNSPPPILEKTLTRPSEYIVNFPKFPPTSQGNDLQPPID